MVAHFIFLSIMPLPVWQENVAIFTELSTFISFSDNTVYTVFPNHLIIYQSLYNGLRLLERETVNEAHHVERFRYIGGQMRLRKM